MKLYAHVLYASIPNKIPSYTQFLPQSDTSITATSTSGLRVLFGDDPMDKPPIVRVSAVVLTSCLSHVGRTSLGERRTTLPDR